ASLISTAMCVDANTAPSKNHDDTGSRMFRNALRNTASGTSGSFNSVQDKLFVQ
ncbi:MAG: hypothetical protein ACI8PT_003048, partial [Gammaproteobacteria bacterium]